MVKVCEVSARPGCRCARRTRECGRAASEVAHHARPLRACGAVAGGARGGRRHMATGKRRTINEPRLSKGTTTRGLFECRAVQVISIQGPYEFSMAMSTATVQLRAATADLNPKHPTCAARLTRRDRQRHSSRAAPSVGPPVRPGQVVRSPGVVAPQVGAGGHLCARAAGREGVGRQLQQRGRERRRGRVGGRSLRSGVRARGHYYRGGGRPAPFSGSQLRSSGCEAARCCPCRPWSRSSRHSQRRNTRPAWSALADHAC